MDVEENECVPARVMLMERELGVTTVCSLAVAGYCRPGRLVTDDATMV